MNRTSSNQPRINYSSCGPVCYPTTNTIIPCTECQKNSVFICTACQSFATEKRLIDLEKRFIENEERLLNRIQILEDALGFLPGGKEYAEIKKHFEDQQSQHSVLKEKEN